MTYKAINQTLWLPADYCDDAAPPGRADANAWVARMATGEFYLEPPDELCDEEDAINQQLTDGQIVDFVTLTDYGSVQLSAAVSMPEGAKMCVVEDAPDTCARDIASCIAEFEKTADRPLGDDKLIFYAYSDNIPMRFCSKSGGFVAAREALKQEKDAP